MTPEKDSYIRSVVDRFFKCSCLDTHWDSHGPECLLNYRHLALAACREVAMADQEYTSSLEKSERILGFSKRYGHRLEEAAAHYEHRATTLEGAFKEIEKILDEVRHD